MHLQRVTITGADDNTAISDLLALSKRYPFVEWGILLSASQLGNRRFPSALWQDRLIERAWRIPHPLNLSAHVCGKWVREMCAGDVDVLKWHALFSVCQRVQLNFHGSTHRIDAALFRRGLASVQQRHQFIFQWDGENDDLLWQARDAGINAVPLFDVSGGAGRLPADWPKAIAPSCGYAGGLSPDNIDDQLRRIASVSGDVPIWIDTETHVRTNEILDMEKVERFLAAVAPYVVYPTGNNYGA
jgi:hypothetical protein